MAARVTINEAELRRITRGESGPVVRHIAQIVRRTTNGAKRRAPSDEGTGRGSIGGTVAVAGTRVIGRVGTPILYMLYQHEGTGIYGPRGRPIRPISRQFLRFEAKSGRSARGSRPIVFARQVKGVPPNPFLVDALKEASPYPVRET